MQYDTYMAANTPQGFVSRFDRLAGEGLERLVLIKGTCGNGKSTLMRRVAERLGTLGTDVERVHCSADAGSLDGVVFPGLRAAVIDATPPHSVEPRLPHAFETVVSLYDAIDGEKVWARRAEVTELSAANKALLERASRCVMAAGSIRDDASRIYAAGLDTEGLHRVAMRMARRLFPSRNGSEVQGRERQRFLGAVGAPVFVETASALCPRLVVVEDESGVCGRELLTALRRLALAAGLDVTTCWCPLRPFDRIDHLLVPGVAGFVTSNAYHRFAPEGAARFRCRRFLDCETLRPYASKLSFDKRAVKSLLGQAAETLDEAKGVHDRLEAIYVAALDPRPLHEAEERIVRLLGGTSV